MMRLRVLLLLGVVLAPLSARSSEAAVQEIAQAIRQGLFQKAVTLADAELASHSGDKKVLTLRGIALQKSQQDTAALASFKQALVTDPTYLPALRAAVE